VLIAALWPCRATLGDEIRIFASEEAAWVYVERPENEGGLTFAVRATGMTRFFAPPDLRDLSAQVQAAAIIGDHLHVFYPKSHRRYHVGLRLSKSVELHLPDGALPRWLGNAYEEGALFAIVDRAAAEAVISATYVEAGSVDEVDMSQQPQLGDAAEALLEYKGGNWNYVATIPDDAQNTSERVMRSAERTLYLAGAFEDHVRVWLLTDGKWSSELRIPTAQRLQLLDIAIADQKPRVIAVAGPSVNEIHLLDTEAPRVIKTQFDEEFDAVAIGAAGLPDRMIVAQLDRNGRALRGQFVYDGEDEHVELVDIVALRQPIDVLLDTQTQAIIAFAILAALFGIAFWRRHDSITRELELPATYRVASYWRRFLAFVLDALPTYYITAPVWGPPMQLWYHEYQTATQGQPPAMPENLLSALLLANAIYAAYCLVCELSFGLTPGKLALRCRIVAEDGHRCRPMFIIARNVLRWIEMFPLFQLWPTIVLVLFTRNRQRLGDLLAKTVVVEFSHAERERTVPSSTQTESET
jgi:uncharacterized RDD family membrane protein YckC